LHVGERRPQPFGSGGRGPELAVDDGDLDRADLGVDPRQATVASPMPAISVASLRNMSTSSCR
jgi:hypothetical protein